MSVLSKCIGGCLALLFAAGLGVVLPWPFPAAAPVGRDVRIFVLTNGVHTDLALPVTMAVWDWRSTVPLASLLRRGDPRQVRFLGFGWGERDFYLHTPTWAELTLSRALGALFVSESSLLHVTAYRSVQSGAEARAVDLSEAAYLKLVGYISESFQRESGQAVVRVADGYADDDAFFLATGHYALWRTCNTWTADGLRASGQPTPLWSGLAPAIMFHLPE